MKKILFLVIIIALFYACDNNNKEDNSLQQDYSGKYIVTIRGIENSNPYYKKKYDYNKRHEFDLQKLNNSLYLYKRENYTDTLCFNASGFNGNINIPFVDATDGYVTVKVNGHIYNDSSIFAKIENFTCLSTPYALGMPYVFEINMTNVYLMGKKE